MKRIKEKEKSIKELQENITNLKVELLMLKEKGGNVVEEKSALT